MKTFKQHLQEASTVDLENKIRNYLLKKKKPISGLTFRDNMKKHDKHNDFESLVHDLITDGEIELKLDGKKKVTRMKDFYKQQYKLKKPLGRADNDLEQWKLDKRREKAIEDSTLTIFTQNNTFKWMGGR